jgi:hypothetical protein
MLRGGFFSLRYELRLCRALRRRCICTTSLPRTGNRAFHPKRDRGGFRRPTLHQNKWDSFYRLQKVTYGRSAFLDREYFCPGLPAILALPANRTPGPYPLAYRLAPTVHTRGGQFRFQATFLILVLFELAHPAMSY